MRPPALPFLLILLTVLSGQSSAQSPKENPKEPQAKAPDVDPYFMPTEGKTHTALPRAIMRNMLPDKSRNIWFGTVGTGVSRYDGKTFTNLSETAPKQ